MKNCSKVLNEALREFEERWDCLYKFTILQQKKWMRTNHDLAEGDLVLITDLLGKWNYPRHGKVSRIEKDNVGVERYFTVEYKIGNREQLVKRRVQSLVLVLKQAEDVQAKICDALYWFQPDSKEEKRFPKKKAVKVSVQVKPDVHLMTDI